MSYDKFKTSSYCVGGRHQSATRSFESDVSRIGENQYLTNGFIVTEKKTKIVSDNTIAAEVLGKFFQNSGGCSAKLGNKLSTNVLNNPARSLQIGAKTGSAAESKKFQAVFFSVPDVIIFYDTDKGSYIRKFVSIEKSLKFV